MNQKEVFIISVTIFLTIVTWIIADLYHIKTTEMIKIGSVVESAPIETHIDEKIVQLLESKK